MSVCGATIIPNIPFEGTFDGPYGGFTPDGQGYDHNVSHR